MRKPQQQKHEEKKEEKKNPQVSVWIKIWQLSFKNFWKDQYLIQLPYIGNCNVPSNFVSYF